MKKKNNIYRSARHYLTGEEKFLSGEINSQPSMTVPDQAMSIREILQRFASGQQLNVGLQAQYDELEDIPDFSKMSWEERADYLSQLQEKTQEMAQKAEKYKAEQKRYKELTEDWQKRQQDIPFEKDKPVQDKPSTKKE